MTMKKRSSKVEESTEELLAQLAAYLEETDDLFLQDMEARIEIAREACNKAYKILRRLKQKAIGQEVETEPQK
jgi:hypothetical protein